MNGRASINAQYTDLVTARHSNAIAASMMSRAPSKAIKFLSHSGGGAFFNCRYRVLMETHTHRVPATVKRRRRAFDVAADQSRQNRKQIPIASRARLIKGGDRKVMTGGMKPTPKKPAPHTTSN